ncbi:hypothetical protein PBY51_001263 [Eleginops maclovinus]|uniref:Uncharacterized protein n=1 Tax=Eleginops maclovinus TaxID=56733 RepID=A0AAN8AC68_ELEMC|nr:hypothetical protein PBY51_001263 [Eleginops maclovinus]
MKLVESELVLSLQEKVRQSVCRRAVSKEELNLQFTWRGFERRWGNEVLVGGNQRHDEAARSSSSVGIKGTESPDPKGALAESRDSKSQIKYQNL